MTMNEHTNDELLQTSCTHCKSSFHLNLPQLLAADGQVRCSQCHDVFDANVHLVRQKNKGVSLIDELAEDIESVSLSDAMNDGKNNVSQKKWSAFYWSIGLLLLVFLSLVQWVYFDRLNLIKDINRQHIVLTVCSMIPCDASQFKSTKQFKLIERNIFTHPTRPNALLINGSFVNEAPFTQKAPSLKISLFNLNSEIIAQRLFLPLEYNQSNQSLSTIAPGENIHFKLEVEDPNTVTITYEFEFL